MDFQIPRLPQIRDIRMLEALTDTIEKEGTLIFPPCQTLFPLKHRSDLSSSGKWENFVTLRMEDESSTASHITTCSQHVQPQIKLDFSGSFHNCTFQIGQ